MGGGWFPVTGGLPAKTGCTLVRFVVEELLFPVWVELGGAEAMPLLKYCDSIIQKLVLILAPSLLP